MTAIAEARGQPWAVGSLILSAWRGQADRAYALLDAVADAADRQGQGYQLVFADYARCILELGHGHYGAAYASSRVDDTSQVKFVLRRSGRGSPALRPSSTPPLVWSPAGQAGHRPARSGDARFPRPGPGAAAGDGGRRRRRGALPGSHQPARPRPSRHLARSHLVYGEWLRRGRAPAGRTGQPAYRAPALRRDRRARLRPRARRELTAAGETVRRSGLRRAPSRPHPAGSASGPASRRQARPTRRSPRSSTSAPTPSTTTSGRYSGSSMSPRAVSSPARSWPSSRN